MAQFNLGVMLRDGEGVPQDYAEAMKWYRLSADQGVAEAQTNLGLMYYHGSGMPQQFMEAYAYHSLPRASQNGSAVKQPR